MCCWCMFNIYDMINLNCLEQTHGNLIDYIIKKELKPYTGKYLISLFGLSLMNDSFIITNNGRLRYIVGLIMIH